MVSSVVSNTNGCQNNGTVTRSLAYLLRAIDAVPKTKGLYTVNSNNPWGWRNKPLSDVVSFKNANLGLGSEQLPGRTLYERASENYARITGNPDILRLETSCSTLYDHVAIATTIMSANVCRHQVLGSCSYYIGHQHPTWRGSNDYAWNITSGNLYAIHQAVETACRYVQRDQRVAVVTHDLTMLHHENWQKVTLYSQLESLRSLLTPLVVRLHERGAQLDVHWVPSNAIPFVAREVSREAAWPKSHHKCKEVETRKMRNLHAARIRETQDKRFPIALREVSEELVDLGEFLDKKAQTPDFDLTAHRVKLHALIDRRTAALRALVPELALMSGKLDERIAASLKAKYLVREYGSQDGWREFRKQYVNLQPFKPPLSLAPPFSQQITETTIREEDIVNARKLLKQRIGDDAARPVPTAPADVEIPK